MAGTGGPDHVVGFYDAFAADYDLAYGGRWESAVARQGAALDGLIRAALPDAIDVLDCSCGIGTQALGLAQRGYRVVGTDVSEGALERARAEAERLGLDVLFAVSDFRVLARLHDWDRDRPCYTLRYLVLTEGEAGWALAEHTTRYRAITRDELASAAWAAGFAAVAWPQEQIVGDQLVMTAFNR